MNERKRRIKERAAVIGVILILIVGVLLVVFREGFKDLIAYGKKAYSAGEVTRENLREGDRVKLDVKTSFGFYLSTTAKGQESADGVTDIRDYLIPVFTDEASAKFDRFLSVRMTGGFTELDIETEKLLDRWKEQMTGESDGKTEQTLNKESIEDYTVPDKILCSVDGRAVRLTDDELDEMSYYFEFLMNGYENQERHVRHHYTFIFYDDDLYRQYIPDYVIVPLWSTVSKSMMFTVAGACALMTVASVGLILFGIIYGRTKRIKEKDSSTEGAL